MKIEAMIGLAGTSLWAFDPTLIGFAPEAHASVGLASLGLAGLLALALWSGRGRSDVDRPRDPHTPAEPAPELGGSPNKAETHPAR